MPTDISRTLFRDLLTLLTPYMRSGLRDVLIDSAFFNTPLIHIDRSGNNRVFASRLLNECLQYGDIEPDEPAIVTMLQELKHHTGLDGQAQIDEMLAQIVDIPHITTPDEILQQTALLLESEDYATVIEYCTQLITEEKLLSEAYSRRARAYERQGNHEQAIADARQAREYDANNPEAYFVRGNIFFTEGAYSEALQLYDIAISLDAVNALFYNNRALTQVALKNYPQAITDYNCAIDRDYGNALLHQNRGQVKMTVRDYAGALADYEQAAELDTTLSGIRRHLKDARAALRWQQSQSRKQKRK